MSDQEVIEYWNDFDTNVIIFCLWSFFCSNKILLKAECDIMIWFASIQDSCIHIMSILFSRSYSRHDIIVFVDLAQLCCKNLIFWVVVLVMKLRVCYLSWSDFDCSKMFAFWVICCVCFVTVDAFRWYMRTWFFRLANRTRMHSSIVIFCTEFAFETRFFTRVD